MIHDDIQVEIYENSSPEITMTIIHIPTGLAVSRKGERRFRLKNDLLDKLRKLIGEE